jgi:putative tricarboxylic transport membrane protein
MTEFLSNIGLGLATAAQPFNLLMCLVGALLGTFVGVLPGIGPLATMAILLPITFYLPPEPALIMLAGIYYGAQYGGSTTAILARLPGETSSIVTCIDGYAMAMQGRAGPALAIAALSSFFAGTLATLVVALFAPGLAKVALYFTDYDYFSLMVLGLVGAVVMARGSVIKAIAMIFVGILLGSVGTDVNTGISRHTLGFPELLDGISFVPIAIGLFGIADMMANLEKPRAQAKLKSTGMRDLWPTRQDFRQGAPAALRGTLVGSALGILPGGGAVLASFASYAIERRVAKQPERFGNGAVEGLAGPEAANNAGAQTSFIPMLTLGLPSNAVMALMIGAMMLQGITPGPQVMTERPALVWGMIASMWIGNLMLLVINLPLIGLWVQLVRVRYEFLSVMIIVFCCIGAYGINNSVFDVFVAVVFGVFGYVLIKLDCEPAPLALGLILGPMMEENLRRGMQLSDGDPSVFFTRPLSLTFLLLAALLLAAVAAPAIRRERREVFNEAD